MIFAGQNHKNQPFSRSSLKTADFSFAIQADTRSIPELQMIITEFLLRKT